jgi:hypothetical protein
MDSDKLKEFINKNLGSEVDGCDLFFFDSDTIKAIAFRDGIHCSCIDDVKVKIKELGFKYNYIYNAYVFKAGDYLYSEYRNHKNDFLDKLIKWKVLTTKTSKNEQKDFGRFVYHQV